MIFSSSIVPFDAKTLRRKLDGDKNEESIRLKTLTNIFKLTGSVQMELVPGSDNYSNYKIFDWTLDEYSEGNLKFLIKFDKPEYISVD